MSPEYIAFQGGFELIDATWSLKTGRTVTFRITGDAFGRNHPFKRFQQRRAGRVGTRFSLSMAMDGTAECLPLMEGMLMAWKDSSSIGQTVSFWLDSDPAIHPFSGCAYRNGTDPGAIFSVAIVELSDDDKPVRQPGAGSNQAAGEHGLRDTGDGEPGVPAEVHAGVGKDRDDAGLPPAATGVAAGPGGRGPASNRPPRRAPGGPRKLSSLAHLTSINSYFVRYLEETKPNVVAKWTPEISRRYVKTILGVESLSDLDRNPDAAARFENLIRKPFARWRYQHPE